MPFTLTEDLTKQEKAEKALNYLARTVVQVGIPPEKDIHSGPFSASGLLALHESGSPINRMPARPVLEPALSSADTKEAMTDAMKQALEEATEGNMDGVRANLELAGQTGENALREYVESGGNLAPTSGFSGWMRNRVSGKPVFIAPKSGGVPLIDTGQLVNAFGYKIKED